MEMIYTGKRGRYVYSKWKMLPQKAGNTIGDFCLLIYVFVYFCLIASKLEISAKVNKPTSFGSSSRHLGPIVRDLIV